MISSLMGRAGTRSTLASADRVVNAAPDPAAACGSAQKKSATAVVHRRPSLRKIKERAPAGASLCNRPNESPRAAGPLPGRFRRWHGGRQPGAGANAAPRTRCAPIFSTADRPAPAAPAVLNGGSLLMVRWSLPFATLVAGGLIGVFLAGPVLQGQAPPATAVPK